MQRHAASHHRPTTIATTPTATRVSQQPRRRRTRHAFTSCRGAAQPRTAGRAPPALERDVGLHAHQSAGAFCRRVALDRSPQSVSIAAAPIAGQPRHPPSHLHLRPLLIARCGCGPGGMTFRVAKMSSLSRQAHHFLSPPSPRSESRSLSTNARQRTHVHTKRNTTHVHTHTMHVTRSNQLPSPSLPRKTQTQAKPHAHTTHDTRTQHNTRYTFQPTSQSPPPPQPRRSLPAAVPTSEKAIQFSF
jgi:plasmid stabilization system protein ParE